MGKLKKFSLHLRTHPGQESSKTNMVTIRGWSVYLEKPRIHVSAGLLSFHGSARRRPGTDILWGGNLLNSPEWKASGLQAWCFEMLRLIVMFLDAAGLIKASLQLAAGWKECSVLIREVWKWEVSLLGGVKVEWLTQRRLRWVHECKEEL